MSADSENGWTTGTIREHVLSLISANDRRYSERFDLIEKATAQALASSVKATDKSEQAFTTRLDLANHIKDAMMAQQGTFMSRNESVALISAANDRLTELKDQLTVLQAERQGVRGGWGYAVGVIGFILTILAIAAMFMKFTK